MVQDSYQLVGPFMRAGTYPARGYATLELSGLELSFTGAYIATFSRRIKSQPQWLTYQYWTGFSSYTSRFRLAGACVFGKQSVDNLLLKSDTRRYLTGFLAELTPSFFAEFLEPSLPVCLGLLDQPTCVGLRYGHTSLSLMCFSWKHTSTGLLYLAIQLAFTVRRSLLLRLPYRKPCVAYFVTHKMITNNAW